MNATTLAMLQRRASRANQVLLQRLEDMGNVMSWHEKRYRQHIAEGCCHGQSEKQALVLACPLFEVAVSGIEAVWPLGHPRRRPTA